jgi:hypothetical protein
MNPVLSYWTPSEFMKREPNHPGALAEYHPETCQMTRNSFGGQRI